MITITIPGTPIAKKRPRFVRRGKYVGTYNAQETEEGRFLWDVQNQYKGEPLADKAISLDVSFHMPIPKGTSKKKAQEMLWGEVCHTKRPDLDNLIKFCLDCLNGVVWKDDTQIVTIYARKLYSATPKTKLNIRPIGEENGTESTGKS